MAEIKNVTITHTCDKCGKEFEKCDYRFNFPGPGYMRDRDDYVFIKFDIDIWYGRSTTNADICPDCAKEILKGVLKKLEDNPNA